MPNSTTDLPDFDALWNFGDAPATEAALTELLPMAREAGDPDYLAQLLSQTARTHGLQGRFETAHALLDEAETLLDSAGPVSRVRVLLERGRSLNSGDDPTRGKAHFLEAWDLARECGADGYAVDAAHMLGIVEPPEEAAPWNQRALDLALSSDDPLAKRWQGSLLNNIGWSRHDAGDFEGALELFEKALAYRTEKNDGRGIRTARWCIARARRSLGRYSEALVEQRLLLTECTAAEEPVGYEHEEIGECLLALDRSDEAEHHFAEAWRVLSQDRWLVAHEGTRLDRLARLGGLDVSDGDVDEAPDEGNEGDPQG